MRLEAELNQIKTQIRSLPFLKRENSELKKELQFEQDLKTLLQHGSTAELEKYRAFRDRIFALLTKAYDFLHNQTGMSPRSHDLQIEIRDLIK